MNAMINQDLAAQISAKREFGELICQKLADCIDKLGFPAGVITSYPDYDSALFDLIKDPLTGLFNLTGVWCDQNKQRIGRLQFQSDDSCYAEYDVIKTHPSKPQWFVENVTAWGCIYTLKAEANLLRLPD